MARDEAAVPAADGRETILKRRIRSADWSAAARLCEAYAAEVRHFTVGKAGGAAIELSRDGENFFSCVVYRQLKSGR